MSGLQLFEQLPGSRRITLNTQLFDPVDLLSESHRADVARGRFQPVTNGSGLPGGGHLQGGLQLRQGLGGAGLEKPYEFYKEIGRATGRQAAQLCDDRMIDPGERVFHDSYLNPRLTPIGRWSL